MGLFRRRRGRGAPAVAGGGGAIDAPPSPGGSGAAPPGKPASFRLPDDEPRPAGAGAPAGDADEQPGRRRRRTGRRRRRPRRGRGGACRRGGAPRLAGGRPALLAASTFPLPPERLVELAKDVLRAGVHKCGRLARDFTFSAPFIGPVGPEARGCARLRAARARPARTRRRAAPRRPSWPRRAPRRAQGFASTMETLSLDTVFPDMAPRVHHLRADPLLPGRVWFTTRPVGTHLGYLTAKLPVPVAPTGKVVELPPQTSSLTFNAEGEVVDFTMGYVQDRRLGNSGGLGGAFGLLYAIGCPFPFPEGKPWAPSLQQRLFNSGMPLLQGAQFLFDRLISALLPSWLLTAHSRNMP
ncbi:hypothetical protein HT031_006384 [Scenedesmus sp. PABB004]|nr:hypothetical protein HT031_006384 [Scenedesmus sp. PABB004]